MGERNIAIRVNEELFKQIKIRLADNGMTMKDYIISLIKQDLKQDAKLLPNAIAIDDSVNAESVAEAQKIIDFVNEIVSNRK